MTTFSFDATKTENTALRVGIVCSRFNEFIVQALLDGAHRGLAKCGVDEKNVTGLPIGFAVLTTENIEQATERSGPGAGNKGEEAAIGAIETWHVLQAIRTPK